MALNEIINHIQTKVDEEVAKIDARSTKDVAERKGEWEKRLVDERDRILTEINRNADTKLTQAKFKIRERVNAEKLKTKQAQLDSVYEKSLHELSELGDAEYTELMAKLLESLKGQSGKISTCAKRAKALEQALSQVGLDCQVSDNLDCVGGFVFHSDQVDLDNRFETIMDQVRQETLIEVHQTLFSN
jgi:vacuolar-type H+-ATPase subunit E/Vma4